MPEQHQMLERSRLELVRYVLLDKTGGPPKPNFDFEEERKVSARFLIHGKCR